MRVVKGKSFEDPKNGWTKIEVEVHERDLPAEAADASTQVKYVLLDNRANYFLLYSLRNSGGVEEEDYEEKIEDLDKEYNLILSKVRPKKTIVKRKRPNEL